MATALHTRLGSGEIHQAHNWEYADASARESATGLVAADIKKLAIQLDDNTLWMLTSISPVTWIRFGSQDITESIHKGLRQLIHFIDNGPAGGFLSGAYREITGTAFPTAVIWYDKEGVGRKKIVQKLITWGGPLPIEITWHMFDSDEAIVETIVDTITYSGVFETSRTRVIS